MYTFKRAETPDELDQLFRLNHAVFAEELKQYEPGGDPRLVDKFHSKNRYWIAVAGGIVVGMVSLHDQPPFSVASRLADPGILEPLGRIAEVRLLAIAPGHRNGMVLTGLLLVMFDDRGSLYDTLAVSGYVAEQKLYHALGFRDLGPPVRSGEAEYIPMSVAVPALAQRAGRWRERMRKYAAQGR